MRFTQAEVELRNYYRNYPWQAYKTFPEFIVKKMNLGIELLEELPSEDNRNRDMIYNWMKNRNFTYEELSWIGW